MIAILAGMLLPALNKAREKAREIACRSNLRQIGLAHQGYINDQNEWIIRGNGGKNGAGTYIYAWYAALSGRQRNGGVNPVYPNYGTSYVDWETTKGTYVCPSEPLPFSSSDTKGFTHTHYAINSKLTGASDNEPFFRKYSSVRQPTIAIFAGDNAIPNGLAALGAQYFAFRHGAKDDRYKNATSNRYLGVGTTNLLFLDGHVDFTKQYPFTSDMLRNGFDYDNRINVSFD